MANTARRMDQVDLGDSSRDVPILQVVFRGPENIPGPVWPSQRSPTPARRLSLVPNEASGWLGRLRATATIEGDITVPSSSLASWDALQ